MARGFRQARRQLTRRRFRVPRRREFLAEMGAFERGRFRRQLRRQFRLTQRANRQTLRRLRSRVGSRRFSRITEADLIRLQNAIGRDALFNLRIR